jgi:hypothetical protein
MNAATSDSGAVLGSGGDAPPESLGGRLVRGAVAGIGAGIPFAVITMRRLARPVEADLDDRAGRRRPESRHG